MNYVPLPHRNVLVKDFQTLQTWALGGDWFQADLSGLGQRVQFDILFAWSSNSTIYREL